MANYRFWKGREFEIYGRRFSKPYLLGVGIFIGKQRTFVQLSHGMIHAWVPVFKLDGMYVQGHECEYKPVGDYDKLETFEPEYE